MLEAKYLLVEYFFRISNKFFKSLVFTIIGDESYNNEAISSINAETNEMVIFSREVENVNNSTKFYE